MPAARSRCCIQAGLGALGSSPVTARAQNWSQPVGSSTRDRIARPSIGGSATESATSRKATPSAVAASRASPRIDRQ